MNYDCIKIKEEIEINDGEQPERIELKFEVDDEWLHTFSSPSNQTWTDSSEDLAVPMDLLTKPQLGFCQICEKRFANRYLLLQHNLSHLEIKIVRVATYQCAVCKVMFLKKNSLETHQVTDHLYTDEIRTKQLHACKICDKLYSYKGWHSHMTSVHAKKQEQCSICKKVFKSTEYLKRHIKYIHQGKKPAWRFRKNLPDNKKGEPLPCSQCEKTFTHPYSLTTHIRNVHPQEGSKECDVCGSILKGSASLRAHKSRVHYYDGKKHFCEVCGKNYKSPRYVRVHMKNKHKEFIDFGNNSTKYQCGKVNIVGRISNEIKEENVGVTATINRVISNEKSTENLNKKRKGVSDNKKTDTAKKNKLASNVNPNVNHGNRIIKQECPDLDVGSDFKRNQSDMEFKRVMSNKKYRSICEGTDDKFNIILNRNYIETDGNENKIFKRDVVIKMENETDEEESNLFARKVVFENCLKFEDL